MARPLPAVLSVLQRVCTRLGITFDIIDDYSSQLVRVSSGERFFLSGTGRVHAYPLNDAPSASVARDKVFAYQMLEAAGHRVPPYEYYFLHDAYRAVRGDGRERADLPDGAARLGFPLFVKPLDGSRGNLADIVANPQELSRQIERIAKVHHGAILQPVLTGHEYRLFMIDDMAMFLYRREPGAFIGDGKRTVAAWLEDENSRRVAHGLSPVTVTSAFLTRQLAQRQLTLDSTLPAGHKLSFLPTANISAGGHITDFSDQVPPALARWGRSVTRALALRVGAIDFFAPNGLDDPASFDIIEANSNPSLAGVLEAGHLGAVERIWHEICARYFDEAPDSG